MADEEETGGDGIDELNEEAEAEGGKKSKKKLIIIIVGALLLLGGVGAALYFTGIIGGDKTEESDAAEGEHGEANGEEANGEEMPKEGEAAPAIVYYDLPDFLVNLNSGGKQSSFLKVTVSLELADAPTAEKIKEFEPRIIDSFQVYLRELRPSDLQGSAGIFRLREELLLRVNKAVHPVRVDDILFKELIVQ